MSKDPPVPLTVFVVVVVTAVWAGTLLACLFTGDYEPLLYTSAPMLGVVGYVTGVKIAKNGRSR